MAGEVVAEAAAEGSQKPPEAKATEEVGEDGMEEDESSAEADEEENGIDDAQGQPPTKAQKRKAKAEASRSEWKARQKAKRKRLRTSEVGKTSSSSRGGGWRSRAFGAGGTETDTIRATGAVAAGEADAPDATSATGNLDKEAIKQARLTRKEAELADFKARCGAGTTVVIDCEWEDYMTDKEKKSFVQQLMYSYSTNRSARRPVRLIFSGLTSDSFTGGKLRSMCGFETWPVEVLQTKYIDNFPKEKLVYLTADAEEVLHEFSPDKIYIIGGIVDHNRLKGQTLAKADEQGIAVAQLPITMYMEMGTSSRVLAVNHVLQIVVEHQADGDWRRVFEKCIPGRKKFLDSADATASGETSTAIAGKQAGDTPSAPPAIVQVESGAVAAPTALTCDCTA